MAKYVNNTYNQSGKMYLKGVVQTVQEQASIMEIYASMHPMTEKEKHEIRTLILNLSYRWKEKDYSYKKAQSYQLIKSKQDTYFPPVWDEIFTQENLDRFYNRDIWKKQLKQLFKNSTGTPMGRAIIKKCIIIDWKLDWIRG
jgi:hypothetical protein